jgi:hypothetical protein
LQGGLTKGVRYILSVRRIKQSGGPEGIKGEKGESKGILSLCFLAPMR